jgi:hypothetical protein
VSASLVACALQIVWLPSASTHLYVLALVLCSRQQPVGHGSDSSAGSGTPGQRSQQLDTPSPSLSSPHGVPGGAG